MKQNKDVLKMKKKKNYKDLEKCKKKLMTDKLNLMPLELKELWNKKKELLVMQKEEKLNIEYKLMKIY